MGENYPEILPKCRLRDLLHVANLRHGTDDFTSPPKEGVLRIFPPLWYLKASTLTPRPPKSHHCILLE